MTYLAYANEGIVASGVAEKLMVDGRHDPLADPLHRQHPEWGRSLYDDHGDGSGICYSRGCDRFEHATRLPLLVNRPPERYSADLYLVDWLDHSGMHATSSRTRTCTTTAWHCSSATG